MKTWLLALIVSCTAYSAAASSCCCSSGCEQPTEAPACPPPEPPVCPPPTCPPPVCPAPPTCPPPPPPPPPPCQRPRPRLICSLPPPPPCGCPPPTTTPAPCPVVVCPAPPPPPPCPPPPAPEPCPPPPPPPTCPPPPEPEPCPECPPLPPAPLCPIITCPAPPPPPPCPMPAPLPPCPPPPPLSACPLPPPCPAPEVETTTMAQPECQVVEAVAEHDCHMIANSESGCTVTEAAAEDEAPAAEFGLEGEDYKRRLHARRLSLRKKARKAHKRVQKREVEYSTCNNEALRTIIAQNLSDDLAVSKRKIQMAAEAELKGRFSVVCSKADFAYVAHTNVFCQASNSVMTCYAFKN